MKIVSVNEMRALEARSEQAGVSTAELMERAGLAVAREVRRLLQGIAGRRIVVLVGPGNNGGDGLVAARHLTDWGAEVSLWRATERLVQADLARADLILDAVLGTGRSRPLTGAIKEVLDLVRDAKARRPSLKAVALDIPTGLNADTGAADPSMFPADVTVTLGFPKQGLYRGADTGRIITVDIGIPEEYADRISLELMTPAMVRPLLPRRPRNANKGTFGKVLVIAGSGAFIGAAVLACRGALRAGTGLVTLAAPARLVEMVAGSLIEPTYLPLAATSSGAIAAAGANQVAEHLNDYSALAIGCGLGHDPETASFLKTLLSGGGQAPALRDGTGMVLDADALNLLAGMGDWWSGLKAPAVLTPHPGEMARLVKARVKDVQGDRVQTARTAAQTWGQTVVLKGAHTVVASPDGLARVSPFAVPALATGGTGDVLTGIIAGLMAQGVEPFDAATAGVYLHGRAGERFTELHGESGLIASDLPGLLPDVFQELR